MTQRIRILKGAYNKLRILDSTFPLVKPVETKLGRTKATIDASSLLGDDYKVLQVEVEEFRLLD